MTRARSTCGDCKGQSLLEIVLTLVLSSALLTGACALFWNNVHDTLEARRLLDATRLAGNDLESLQTLSWAELGALTGPPQEETLGPLRRVRTIEDVEWTGTDFRATTAETDYRRITVAIFPAEGEQAEPYQWVLLRVHAPGT
ncbi:MAG: hypothetical protein AB1640_23115 [bacterium]